MGKTGVRGDTNLFTSCALPGGRTDPDAVAGENPRWQTKERI
jgi:hypothetical protein